MADKTDTESEDIGITMVDVLQEEEDLETEAAAVLGAGDDSVCTYKQGYVKRQALYTCLTCCTKGNRGAICLGCSYHCHENHQLVELYTKRNVRCDCGNSKFEGKSCKLNSEKEDSNDKNNYNHNYDGNYCTCERPYPDPEDDIEDAMIQCIICEDWYHGRHLDTETLPDEESYGELICHLCASAKESLRLLVFNVLRRKEEESNEKNVDVTSVVGENLSLTSSASVSSEKCKMTFQTEMPDNKTGPYFLENEWRQELCQCTTCLTKYSDESLSYLVDTEDTLISYESRGLAKKRSMSEEREMNALASLDRVTLGEVVHEYNNFSTSFRDYLKKFAENGKIVRSEDIKEFFTELSAKNKKQKVGIPYHCR